MLLSTLKGPTLDRLYVHPNHRGLVKEISTFAQWKKERRRLWVLRWNDLQNIMFRRKSMVWNCVLCYNLCIGRKNIDVYSYLLVYDRYLWRCTECGNMGGLRGVELGNWGTGFPGVTLFTVNFTYWIVNYPKVIKLTK